MKRSVVIIFMTEEESVTAKAIASIAIQLRPDDKIFVLHNGMDGPSFRRKYEQVAGVQYFESKRNLGVAGGRNFLFRQSACWDSDLIFLVDSDAIAPSDYLDRMTEFMADTPDVGVAGPVVLNYHAVKLTVGAQNKECVNEPLGASYFDVDTAKLDRLFQGRLSSRILDHVGTNPDWENGYFRSTDAMMRIYNKFGAQPLEPFPVSMKFHSEAVQTLNSPASKISVTNIAGCCQVFSGELLREIGDTYDLYSPYGHEDVDFCLKAIRAGKVNYTTNTTYLLHQTDDRHSERNLPTNQRRKAVNESRVRTILEYRWKGAEFPRVSFERVLTRSFATFVEGDGDHRRATLQLANELVGVRQAVDQLANAEGRAFGEVLLDDLENNTERQSVIRMLSDRAAAAAGVSDAYSALSRSKQQRVLRPRQKEGRPTRRFNSYEVKRNLDARRDELLSRRGSYPASKRDVISDRQRQQIAGFKDIHKGERCFIIGNGPSLKKVNFNLLRNEFTFGVNGLFYMFDDIGFTPTYYVVEDNHVIDDNLERIVALPSVVKFFPAKYQPSISGETQAFFLPTDWEFYYKSSQHHEKPRFSEDLSEVAYVGQTVTYLNMQLAHYMGFSEVYLIGVDFDYKVPKSSQIEGFTILSQEDDPNHFHPEYFGKGKKWHFPKLENCEKVYRHARGVYQDTGRQIFDATIGGKLEVYEKTDFYGLFDNPPSLRAPNAQLVSLTHHVLNEAISASKPCQFRLSNDLDTEHLADLQSLQNWFLGLVGRADANESAGYISSDSSDPELAVRVLTPSDIDDLSGVDNERLDIFVGLATTEVTDHGRHLPTEALAQIVGIYETVYILKDIIVGARGISPALFRDQFGLKLDGIDVQMMNPRIALALAGEPVTKRQTISTLIYKFLDNVFGMPTEGNADALDYSLVGALIELGRPVAIRGERVYFPG